MDRGWYDTMSDKLKILMQEHNLTPEQLARQAGVSANLVKRCMAADMAQCGLQELAAIAKVLGVAPDALLFDEERES